MNTLSLPFLRNRNQAPRPGNAETVTTAEGETGEHITAATNYGLLLCVLMVSLPHVQHLPVWTSAVCVAMLAWRAHIVRSALPLPPRWLLFVIILGGTVGIFSTYHTLFGRDASVSLLILLTSLKQLEVRGKRDAGITLNLACFIVITNFFYSQTMLVALYMLATLLVVITVWLGLQASTLPLRARLRTAAIMLTQAVPLMVVLFVMFPRVQGPLWGMPQDAYATSGLDDKMSPGSLSKLSLSDAVAFRATFTSAPPPHRSMYWRGPVLTFFDGKTWTPGVTRRYHYPQLRDLGDPVDYIVTLEPHNKIWLFGLDMPTNTSVNAVLTHDFRLVLNKPVTERLRYAVHSELSFHANIDEEPYQLVRALQLPADIDPRSRQLAREWRAASKDTEEVVRKALAYFNQQGFGYTLEPPLLAGDDQIDDFMFNTRQGFCEHFASAFVFLMRAAGIPARVVTGYQGGEYNSLGGYFIIRQSDAHAWAEVWTQGKGWLRVDPTAVVAPARVQTGLAAAVPDTAVLPFMARTHSPWLNRLRLNLDALANQWNQWVLSYNPERQYALMTRLGMESVSWTKMAFGMTLGVALLAGLFFLLMLRRLYARDTDETRRLYRKFCRKLEKAGIRREEHEGPRDFAARATRLKPQLSDSIQNITERYIRLRYGERRDGTSLQTLRREIGAFKP